MRCIMSNVNAYDTTSKILLEIFLFEPWKVLLKWVKQFLFHYKDYKSGNKSFINKISDYMII